MVKSVIDNMSKVEILELLSPYLDVGDSGKNYYQTMQVFDVKLELVDDPTYLYGKINIYININGDKWIDTGSVGKTIYNDIVTKYRDMTLNKIL